MFVFLCHCERSEAIASSYLLAMTRRLKTNVCLVLKRSSLSTFGMTGAWRLKKLIDVPISPLRLV